MSENNRWLRARLQEQRLTQKELRILNRLREQIERQIRSGIKGGKRVLYGGSFGKKTMIRAKYDLDVVVYWNHRSPWTIQNIYLATGEVLKRNWENVKPKNVGWEISFGTDFHIDVVPGRAMDINFREANLYRKDTDTTLKTSLQKHILTVRKSRRRDVIRLMKLWRERNGVPFPRSFALELMTIEGTKGTSLTDLEAQFNAALHHLYDVIEKANVVDPANTNNNLMSDLDMTSRRSIKEAAREALITPNWNDVIW